MTINIDKTIFNYIKSYLKVASGVIKIIVDKNGLKLYNNADDLLETIEHQNCNKSNNSKILSMKLTISLNNYLEILTFSFYSGYDSYQLAQKKNQIFISKSGEINLHNLQIITDQDLNVPIPLSSAIYISNW